MLLDEFRAVVNAFQKVGASRPVDLGSDGKRLVLEAIHVMAAKSEDGFDGVDRQLVELHRMLVEELGHRRKRAAP